MPDEKGRAMDEEAAIQAERVRKQTEPKTLDRATLKNPIRDLKPSAPAMVRRGASVESALEAMRRNNVGCVLVLDRAKGGVASAWMLNEMVANGKAPAALLMNWSNPVLAQGAALAGLALADAFELDITATVRTGDRLEIDPAARTVRILERVAP